MRSRDAFARHSSLCAQSRGSHRARVALALIAATLAGCGSCHKDTDATPPEASAVVAPEPPVAAPDGLLADVIVATPDATWKRVQTGVGGAAAVLPDSFAGVVCALAGLEPAVAREVDGAAPAYAALVDEGGAIGFAVAMKLADARRAQTLLLESETAAFTAKDADGVRVLASKALPLQLAVGVARSGWLLVASNDAGLAKVAPYTYRTLPARQATSAIAIDVPRAALAGPLRARASATWGDAKAWLLQRDAEERAKHGGRAPDFGDAPAIVACVDAAVERRLAVLGDLDAVHVAVDATDDDVHATASLEPSGAIASKWFDAMRPGPAAPLLEVPADAVLAWLVRDDAAARAEDAREIEQCVERALGKRAGDEDARRMRALAEAWSKGRGEWVLGSASWGASRGLALRGPTPDADAAGRAVRDGVEMLRRPLFADPLKRLLGLGDVTVATVDAPPLGKVNVATLARDEHDDPKRPKAKVPPPLGVAWLGVAGQPGEVTVALGESPASLLAATAKPKARLGDDARAARAVGALEANAVTALLVQWGTRTPGAPPVVVAWGRRGKAGWGRVEVGYATVRELVRNVVAP